MIEQSILGRYLRAVRRARSAAAGSPLSGEFRRSVRKRRARSANRRNQEAKRQRGRARRVAESQSSRYLRRLATPGRPSERARR